MVYCTSCVLQCDDTFVLNAFCYAGEEEKNATKLCRKYELHTFAIVMMWSLACVPHLMLITSSASCFERRALSLSPSLSGVLYAHCTNARDRVLVAHKHRPTTMWSASSEGATSPPSSLLTHHRSFVVHSMLRS